MCPDHVEDTSKGLSSLHCVSNVRKGGEKKKDQEGQSSRLVQECRFGVLNTSNGLTVAKKLERSFVQGQV